MCGGVGVCLYGGKWCVVGSVHEGVRVQEENRNAGSY